MCVRLGEGPTFTFDPSGFVIATTSNFKRENRKTLIKIVRSLDLNILFSRVKAFER